jgi:hypothetical protein
VSEWVRSSAPCTHCRLGAVAGPRSHTCSRCCNEPDLRYASPLLVQAMKIIIEDGVCGLSLECDDDLKADMVRFVDWAQRARARNPPQHSLHLVAACTLVLQRATQQPRRTLFARSRTTKLWTWTSRRKSTSCGRTPWCKKLTRNVPSTSVLVQPKRSPCFAFGPLVGCVCCFRF